MIKKAKKSFQNRLVKRYQNLSEEEKDKKRQYARDRYRNPAEEEKEKERQYGRERYKKFIEDEKHLQFF